MRLRFERGACRFMFSPNRTISRAIRGPSSCWALGLPGTGFPGADARVTCHALEGLGDLPRELDAPCVRRRPLRGDAAWPGRCRPPSRGRAGRSRKIGDRRVLHLDQHEIPGIGAASTVRCSATVRARVTAAAPVQAFTHLVDLAAHLPDCRVTASRNRNRRGRDALPLKQPPSASNFRPASPSCRIDASR